MPILLELSGLLCIIEFDCVKVVKIRKTEVLS